MVEHLGKYGCVKDIEWNNCSSFQAPIIKIVPKDLFEWINRHQQIASVFINMVPDFYCVCLIQCIIQISPIRLCTDLGYC